MSINTSKGVNTDFTSAVAFCNACHAAAGFSYVVYKVPDQPDVRAKLDTGQKFTTADLRPILADMGILQ